MNRINRGLMRSGSVNAIVWAISMVMISEAATAQDVTAESSSPQAEQAADAEESSNEIVVTARLRSERLIDVPVAVSVMSADDVARYNTTSLQQIAMLVPQLSIATTGGSGAGAAFSIRGIGSPITDPGLDQSVAISIDGTQISRGRVAEQSFFDVDRVEVLKGPQALFFGKNSPAGVISLTSAGPTNDLSGYINVGYEFKARERFVEGAIAGPLGSGFGARLALKATEMDGWIRNVAKPIISPFSGLQLPGAPYSRAPASNQLLGRLTLTYDSEPFDAVLKVFGSRNRGASDFMQEPYCKTAHPHTFGVEDVQNDCVLNNRVSVSGDNPTSSAGLPGTDGRIFYTKTDSILTSLKLTYHADKFSITSTTSYYDYDQRQYGSPGGSFAIPYSTTGENYWQFSEELRLLTDLGGPVNFLLGGYYEKTRRRDQMDINLFPFLGADPVTGLFYSEGNYALVHGKTLSAFGQAIIKLSPNIELTGGLRYTREEKDSVQANTFINPNIAVFLPLVPVGVLLRDNPTFNNVSPEATLTWHPTSQSTLYAAFKTGYKSGGIAAPNVISADFANPASRNFNPEKAIGGEIGYKAQMLDGRLRFNAAIYSYTFKDLQVASFNAQTTTFVIRNAAKARATGIEVDANYKASDNVSLRGAAAYNHGRYTSFPDAPCPNGSPAGCLQDLKGSQLPRSPDWNISGGFTISQPIGDSMKISFDGDAVYTSSYWMQQNNDPLSRQNGYVRIDAGIRFGADDDRYTIALIGRNLTDKRYGVISYDYPFGNPGELAVTVGRARSVMIQGSVRF